LRERKYDWLLENDIKTINWVKLSPTSPYYFFVQREERGREIYENYWKITDIFPVNCVGIVTARDKFAIDFDMGALKRRIAMFRNLSMPDELIKQTFKLKDTSTFKLRKSREILSKDENWDEYFTEILYRPFDKRTIYYTNIVVERPLLEVMRHMLQKNLALCIGRAGQVVGLDKPWNIVFCSDHIEDLNLFYRGGNVNFPLYLYPDIANSPDNIRGTNRTMMMVFEPTKTYRSKNPNINQMLFESLIRIYDKAPAPEEIFYYIYAVLYSNAYRTKYAEFLKIDFPRVPFTKDYKLFDKMAEHGKRLVDLHLLKSAELDPPIAKFQGEGDERVQKLRYDEKEKYVYVNQGQYFEGVTKEVWQYQIGGYQVCHKWLKDRKGRRLSLDDIKHYCKIVTTLQKTIEIQKAIDDIYPEVEKETVESKK